MSIPSKIYKPEELYKNKCTNYNHETKLTDRENDKTS